VGGFLHLLRSRHKITPLSTEGYLQRWGALQIHLKFSPSVHGGHLKISVNIILDDATFMNEVPCAMLSSQNRITPIHFLKYKIFKFFMWGKWTWDEAVLGICIPWFETAPILVLTLHKNVGRVQQSGWICCHSLEVPYNIGP
jgi:hypothetical protein